MNENTDLIKLKAPDGTTDVSFGGDNYAVADDGTVSVPAEACAHLYQFGFVNHVEEPGTDPDAAAKAEAEAKAAAEAAAAAAAEAEAKAKAEAEAQAAAKAPARKK